MLSSLSGKVKIIGSDKISLSRDNSGILRVKIEGEAKEYPIKPMRYFPFTEEEGCYVGLFRVESDGTISKEIALITDFKRLDDHSRKLLEEELDKNFPLITVKKIVSIQLIGNKLRWKAITDKGEKVFIATNKNILSPSVMSVKDTKGRKYKINIAMLDSESQSILEARI